MTTTTETDAETEAVFSDDAPGPRTHLSSAETGEKHPKRRDSFEVAAQEFLDAVDDSLTAEDEPAATALLMTARALDQGITGPLLAQYGLTHRHLVKRLSTSDGEPDPLEGLLGGER